MSIIQCSPGFCTLISHSKLESTSPVCPFTSPSFSFTFTPSFLSILFASPSLHDLPSSLTLPFLLPLPLLSFIPSFFSNYFCLSYLPCMFFRPLSLCPSSSRFHSFPCLSLSLTRSSNLLTPGADSVPRDRPEGSGGRGSQEVNRGQHVLISATRTGFPPPSPEDALESGQVEVNESESR